MSIRHAKLIEKPQRRLAVLAVAFLLLGFQLVGGSLHASAHDSAGDCQICLSFDRLDTAATPFIALDAGPAAEVLRPQFDQPLLVLTAPRGYAIRAPPASRRF
jgi:hypothetical protein